MKKVLFAAALIGLTLISCGDDDSNPTTVNASIDGTWKLTGFTLDNAIDLNGDGVASTDMVNETDCYSNSELVFTSATEVSLMLEGLDIEVSGNGNDITLTVDCLAAETLTGTYTVTDTTVTLSGEIGNQGEDVVMVRSGNTLSVDFNEIQSIPIEGPNGTTFFDVVGGTVTFTKQ